MNETEYEKVGEASFKELFRIVDDLELFIHNDRDHFVILLKRRDKTQQALIISYDESGNLKLDVKRPTYSEPLDAQFIYTDLTI